MLGKKIDESIVNTKINTSQATEIQILKEEVRKMVYKVGGIDSGYVSGLTNTAPNLYSSAGYSLPAPAQT